jgi:hypothetical protein
MNGTNVSCVDILKRYVCDANAHCIMQYAIRDLSVLDKIGDLYVYKCVAQVGPLRKLIKYLIKRNRTREFIYLMRVQHILTRVVVGDIFGIDTIVYMRDRGQYGMFKYLHDNNLISVQHLSAMATLSMSKRATNLGALKCQTILSKYTTYHGMALSGLIYDIMGGASRLNIGIKSFDWLISHIDKPKCVAGLQFGWFAIPYIYLDRAMKYHGITTADIIYSMYGSEIFMNLANLNLIDVGHMTDVFNRRDYDTHEFLRNGWCLWPCVKRCTISHLIKLLCRFDTQIDRPLFVTQMISRALIYNRSDIVDYIMERKTYRQCINWPEILDDATYLSRPILKRYRDYIKRSCPDDAYLYLYD